MSETTTKRAYPAVAPEVAAAVVTYRAGAQDEADETAPKVRSVGELSPLDIGQALELHVDGFRVGMRLGRYEAEVVDGVDRYRLYSDVPGGQVSYVVVASAKVVIFP